MKTSYESFVKSKNMEIGSDELNEGLFDMFKKLFGKIGQYYNKISGGNEIKKIYTKYKQKIQDEFAKIGITELNLNAGDGEIKKESNSFIKNYNDFLFEAEASSGADLKAGENTGDETGAEPPLTPPTELEKKEGATGKNMTVNSLKQKLTVLLTIVKKYQEMALKEMDQVLVKKGGAEKNPKLKIIIGNTKDQLMLDFLEAQVEYLEKSGDKTMINKVKADRDKTSRDLTARWNTIDKAGDVDKGGQLIIGMYYRYKTPDGVKTIKILKQSPIKGKILACYLISQDGTKDKEQTFTIENIDTEFKPEVGKDYFYYSETNKKIITVNVISYDEDTKKLTLKGNSTFVGHIGALRDLVVKETEKPAEQTEKPATQQAEQTEQTTGTPATPEQGTEGEPPTEQTT